MMEGVPQVAKLFTRNGKLLTRDGKLISGEECCCDQDVWCCIGECEENSSTGASSRELIESTEERCEELGGENVGLVREISRDEAQELCDEECTGGGGPIACVETRDSASGITRRTCESSPDMSGDFETIDECISECDFPDFRCITEDRPFDSPVVGPLTRSCDEVGRSPIDINADDSCPLTFRSPIDGIRYEDECCCCHGLTVLPVEPTNLRVFSTNPGSGLANQDPLGVTSTITNGFQDEVEVSTSIDSAGCLSHGDNVSASFSLTNMNPDRGQFYSVQATMVMFNSTIGSSVISNANQTGPTNFGVPIQFPFNSDTQTFENGFDPSPLNLDRQCFTEQGLIEREVLPPFANAPGGTRAPLIFGLNIFIAMASPNGFLDQNRGLFTQRFGKFECCNCESETPAMLASGNSASSHKFIEVDDEI